MKPTALTCRSRKGCLACRRIHAKCDEQRPGCSRCYYKNLTCDYGIRLVWPDESLAKGVHHGRGAKQSSYSNATASSNGSDLTSWAVEAGLYGAYFLNTSIDDIEEHGHVSLQSRHKFTSKMESPKLDQHRSLTPTPQCDENLISFYNRILCGAATVEDNSKGNPFRALLIPLAMESTPVLNAMQAVSAKVLALHQPIYRRAALHYHTDALRGLVGTIDGLGKSSARLFEACAVCMLLCWFEICCDTNGRWISHLTGLLHLLARGRETRAMPPFIINYLFYHCVIARTTRNIEPLDNAIKGYFLQATCRTDPSDNDGIFQKGILSDCSLEAPDIRTFLSSEHASGTTRVLLHWMGPIELCEINTYPGMSSGLLLLMNQIADLESVSNSHQIAEHTRKTVNIKVMLENHVQYASTGLQGTTILQACASAETYRLACLLYLHHKVTSIRAHIVVRTTVLTPIFTEPQISDLAFRIVAQLEDKLSLPRTMANPLWPLFIAACSTDNEDLRIRIMALFSQIESDQRYCNVPQVRMIIEKIWRRRDLGADQPMLLLRKYNKVVADREAAAAAADFRQAICCDWDLVMRLMANFTWSLT